jgi:glycosyltransferase involved in cell wall biosynthesis
MSMERRVLIIAYHYPPLAGAGVLKILRTTRYLSKYGWKPLVLTVKNPEPYHQADNPIPDSVSVFRSWRIPGGNLLARILRRLKLDERWLLLPDQYLFWIPGTVLYGLYLILRHRVDLIYVTAPPYSTLICGAFLKLLTGKPLISDIRDPWSFNGARRRYPTRFHGWIDRRWEEWVLRCSDYITCIYRITEAGYYQRYPWTRGKISVFYDTVDLADLPDTVEPYPKFTLTYLGTFYPPFTTLIAVLKAIQGLLNRSEIDPKRFCFNYVGPHDKQFDELVRRFGLEGVVRRSGYQPVKEAQREAFRSQLLLLLLEFPTINTKLFDYLASGNPILAVVPEFSELEELLAAYASRYAKVTDGAEQKIAESIKQCYNEYYQGKLHFNSEKAEKFRSRLNIEHETRQLAEIFDKVIMR